MKHVLSHTISTLVLIVALCMAGAGIASTADAGPDRVVLESERSFSLDGTGSSSDPAGLSLSYSWTIISASSPIPGSFTGTDTATPQFVSVFHQVGDVFVFSLVVDDGIEESVADTVTITVVSNPVADPGLAQTVASAALVQLDGTGSTPSLASPSGSIVQYLWTSPGGVQLSDASATPSFTAPNLSPGAAPVELEFFSLSMTVPAIPIVLTSL